MTEIFAFQNAFHSSALSISMRRRLGSISTGNSPWITVNAPPGRFVIACMLQADVVLTTTAGVNAVANTDILYEWIDQYAVSEAEGVTPRTEVVTTPGCEEVERLVFDTAQGWSSNDIATQSAHIGSYPRVAASNFASPATRTDTSELWIPVGGPSAAIRFHVPAITGVFATVTTATYTVSWSEVYSPYGGVVAAREVVTPSLAAGNQDIMNFVPKDMAIDLISFIGVEATSDLTEIYMADNSGAQVINMDSGPTTGELITATQYIYPRFANNSPPDPISPLVFSLSKTYPVSFRIKVGDAQTFDIVFLAWTGPNVAPPNPASPTPTTPAVSHVGKGVSGVGPTPMKPA